MSSLKLRKTRPRQVILEELKKVTSHPTADEMHALVRRRLPRVSLATVYRNLMMLSEAGLIQRLELGGRQRHFDGEVQIHSHLRCLGCDKVQDLPMIPLPPLENLLGEARSGEILDYRLEFIGRCRECSTGSGKALEQPLPESPSKRKEQ